MSVTMLIGFLAKFLARKGGFCTSATKWDTPTLNGHSLAPIGQNDPGPFSRIFYSSSYKNSYFYL